MNALESAVAALGKVRAFPFYIDQANSRGVWVKDCQGITVFLESFTDFPDEFSSNDCETVVKTAHAVANLLIEVSITPMGINQEIEKRRQSLLDQLKAERDEAMAIIEQFGRTVTDMFEQMERGDWQDNHGHSVKLNREMIALKQPVLNAIALRAAISKATGQAL